MKNKIITIVLILISGKSFGQNFGANISGTFGLLNPKIRIQCELPLGDKLSYGGNLNYYLVNWKGPIIEPFLRFYVSNDENENGLFLQAKAIYGNLTHSEIYSQSNTRWSTYGGGLAVGYKAVMNSGFCVDILTGYRLLTPPSNTIDVMTSAGSESASFLLTTGFPLDFQLKFGYQF